MGKIGCNIVVVATILTIFPIVVTTTPLCPTPVPKVIHNLPIPTTNLRPNLEIEIVIDDFGAQEGVGEKD